MRALMMAITLLISGMAWAQTAPVSDAVETRARDVGHALRCVVCQNQSIEESDAPLAKDMRILVRERIAAGDSDSQVIAYMRDRYGDYVLLKPPLQRNTFVLWFLPLAMLLAMVVWIAKFSRRKPDSPEAAQEFTQEDKDRLKALMDKPL